MKLRIATALMIFAAAAGSIAQSPAPEAGGVSPLNPAASAGMRSRAPLMQGRRAPDAVPSLHQRVQDMESTVAKMHDALIIMRKKAALNPKDSMAKANLDLWELMVGHLDNELRDLKTAMLVREDMDARRAAMYKQADAKAQAEAAQARQNSSPQAAQPAATESPK